MYEQESLPCSFRRTKPSLSRKWIPRGNGKSLGFDETRSVLDPGSTLSAGRPRAWRNRETRFAYANWFAATSLPWRSIDMKCDIRLIVDNYAVVCFVN